MDIELDEGPLDFADPELAHIEDSEIAAAVDISTFGTDKVWRPVLINQEEEVLVLTLEDAKRLYGFLQKAIVFVEEYQQRKTQ